MFPFIFPILAKVSAFLTMGTDYPVKAHSLIKALPSRIMPSKVNFIASLRKTMSPGTTSTDDICMTFPYLKTLSVN